MVNLAEAIPDVVEQISSTQRRSLRNPGRRIAQTAQSSAVARAWRNARWLGARCRRGSFGAAPARARSRAVDVRLAPLSGSGRRAGFCGPPDMPTGRRFACAACSGEGGSIRPDITTYGPGHRCLVVAWFRQARSGTAGWSTTAPPDALMIRPLRRKTSSFVAGRRRSPARRLCGTVPVEVTTDRAPVYPRVLDESGPSALHTVGQYANNPIEADHGRLKARLRPMCGLDTAPLLQG
jgi:hypothetical protein